MGKLLEQGGSWRTEDERWKVKDERWKSWKEKLKEEVEGGKLKEGSWKRKPEDFWQLEPHFSKIQKKWISSGSVVRVILLFCERRNAVNASGWRIIAAREANRQASTKTSFDTRRRARIVAIQNSKRLGNARRLRLFTLMKKVKPFVPSLQVRWKTLVGVVFQWHCSQRKDWIYQRRLWVYLHSM